MNEINNIVLIGSGNVATNLAIAFHNNGKNIIQVISRSNDTAKILADKVSATYTNTINDINLKADLYIISVNDDAIASIASSLNLENKLVVHTSGSIEIDVLKNTSTNYGVLYPLQTFSKETLVDFKNIPFCIEANNLNNSKAITELAGYLSEDVRLINSNERKVIHLAAVFACNFTNYMYLIAEDILKEQSISFDILKPLILKTAKNIVDSKPENTQTGPAKRNDQKLIEKHLTLLKDNPEYKEIYTIISKSILNKFHK